MLNNKQLARLLREKPEARVAPGVLSGPGALAALRSGVDTLAAVVRPTLGPLPRTVAVHDVASGRPIEVLDDAATILRRMIEIPGVYTNMGAMMLRHSVWKTFEAVGDGGAITAILFQALLRRLGPYVVAGGDTVALRRDLERGLAAAIGALREQARPLEGPEAIARVAETLCHDAELAAMLGEIFDIIGGDGYLQVERGYAHSLERQYVEGLHWNEGFRSAHFITDQDKQEVRLEYPSILISDLTLTSAEELVPLLDQLVTANSPGLLIIADEVSGSALALLLANHQKGTLRSIAVKAPSHEPQRTRILEDLAVLTGGRVVTEQSGRGASTITLADLGRARQAWANAGNFGLYGGDADPAALRRRILEVRAELAATEPAEDRERVRERLGKLMGGVAILRVGAVTAGQQDTRKALAQRTATALRLALASGVAPGGGAAYVACQPALRALATTTDGAVALRALADALGEPLAVIAANAGFEPSTIAARVKAAPPGWGFDALSGEVVDMRSAGIMDPVAVLEKALETAVSGAMMALGCEVLVHRRDPLKQTRP